ncbi:MAG: D-alanyl-D-alanine carboxypeptidase/D-alanyl-D-alanine-endopeptidase [Phycisphaerales bacterium]
MGRVLGVVLSVLCVWRGAIAQDLQAAFDGLRQRTEMGATSMSAIAIDGRNGRVLWSHHADEAKIPASNMKLLTSGAALMVLGPDFAFETRLVDAGNRIVLIGSGDPALGDPAVLQRGENSMTFDDLIDSMVQAVVQRGIKAVEEIVIDDRVFDRNYVHETWPIDQLNRAYCAEVAGVNLHANVLTVFMSPAPGGRGLPEYRTEPTVPWVEIENLARTVQSGRQTAWVARPLPENRFQLRGDVAFAGAAPVEVAFHEPPLMAGRILADRLSKAGVRVGLAGRAQGIDAVRLVEPNERLATGQPLVVVRTSIADVLRQCNTESHNLYAEALIKRLAHEVSHEPGSWEAGAAVIRMLLSERLGPDTASRTRIADGSGMSRENRVSAQTLAAWLREIDRNEAIRGAMLESLATPGVGTLRQRFGEITLSNQVFAKSGYLNGVRSLSGYVIAPSGNRVIFAMLLNDIPAGVATQNTKLFLERCVDLADDWLADQEPISEGRLGG